jgi:hypothetical protein
MEEKKRVREEFLRLKDSRLKERIRLEAQKKKGEDIKRKS